jgi:cytoskeletal protein CcmA (bactofilin family)
VDGAIMLTLSCHWIGNVTADVLVIKGRVDGNVSARFKLELRPTAQVTGNLSSPLIALGQGAVVRGAISRDSVVTRFQERRTH